MQVRSRTVPDWKVRTYTCGDPKALAIILLSLLGPLVRALL